MNEYQRMMVSADMGIRRMLVSVLWNGFRQM